MAHTRSPIDNNANSIAKGIRALLFGVLATTVLSGCGFTLRGQLDLPAGTEFVRIVSQQPSSPLSQAVQKRSDLSYANADSSALAVANNTVEIRLLGDRLERRLLSLFPTGQVAEYELLLSVDYLVTFPGQDSQAVTVDIARDYQDDPDEVLAKSRELELVLSEMRDDAADRIIRLLPSQR